MNFILFILFAVGLKKVVEPLRQLSIMEVITLTHFIRLTCCHGSYSGSPPFTIYRLGNKKNHSQVGQIFLNHSQVGQAITAEATTLAPWAKLGRRASRHDDHNMKHRGAISGLDGNAV